MVLHLAEHLEIPLRERNGLLLAAGYAPLYPERSLDTDEMQPVRQVLDRFLRAHEPYPAIVIDRHHNLLASNDALGMLIDGVSPELLESPANALRIALHPVGMAPGLSTWRVERAPAAAVATRGADHRRPGTRPPPPRAGQLPGGRARTAARTDERCRHRPPLRLRAGEDELAFFSTLSTFGTAVDITLAELAIEAFYPRTATPPCDCSKTSARPPRHPTPT